MNACDKFRTLLEKYLDGELTRSARLEIEAHLGQCPSCSKELESLRRVFAATEDELFALPAPEGFEERVGRSVAKLSRKRNRWTQAGDWLARRGRWAWQAGLVAACLALAGMSVYIANINRFVKPRQVSVYGQGTLAWSSPATLRVVLSEGDDDHSPAVNAPVWIHAKSTDGRRSQLVFAGRSNELGVVDAAFRLPTFMANGCVLSVDSGSAFDRDSLDVPITVNRTAKILVTTDKPVYQPGQTIHIRALGMYPDAGAAAANEKMAITVKDAKGTSVFQDVETTSRFGVASADFELAEQVGHGDYAVSAKIGDEFTSQTVRVDNYVLPKFKVTAICDRPFYAPGDTLKVHVAARYFFGKPVAGAKLVVKLDEYAFGFQELASLSAKTDAYGQYEASLDLPNMFVGDGKISVNLDAVVTDKSGHQERTSTPVIVSGDPIEVDVAPANGRALSGIVNTFYLMCRYPDGVPVKATGTLHDIAGGGGVAIPFTTDDMGVAAVRLKVTNPTTMTLAIDVADALGTQSHVQRTVAVDGSGKSAVLLSTGNSVYGAGDTLRGAVRGARRSGAVYLDLVRDGQTISMQTVELQDGAASFVMDLPPDLSGLVTLHSYIGSNAPDLQVASKLLLVRPADGLNVRIQPDKTVYRPGEDAHVVVSVTDKNGDPVSSAVGVSVADESVFAVREDDPGMAKYYFSLQKDILQPRYEIKDLLTQSMEPGPPISAPDLQLRAGAALASYATQQFVNGNDSDVGQATSDTVNTTSPELNASASTDHIRAVLDFQSAYLLDLACCLVLCLFSWVMAGLWRPFVGIVLVGLVVAALASAFGAVALSAGLAAITSASLLALTMWKPGLPRWRERHMGWVVLLLIAGAMVVIGVLDATSRGKARQASSASNLKHLGGGGGGFTLAAPMAGRHANAAGGFFTDNGAFKIMNSVTYDATAATPPQATRPPRVRQYFPETLFWQPEVITDGAGKATLTIPMADTITSWRMTALASTADDRLGTATQGIKVFQDFFVDPDLPLSATQGDQITIPVAIHNYLPTPQLVSVTVAASEWFTLVGQPTLKALVPAQDVGVVRFPIKITKFGRENLNFTAQGSSMADAVVKPLDVLPAGDKQSHTYSDVLSGTVTRTISIPSGTIPGTQSLALRLHPGVISQVVQGLDGMLQVPYGCFEQTSSITYPNILVLQYLKDSGTIAPDIRMKAEQDISLGYQRIVSYEVRGGGFDWWGQAPAKTVLTALGVMELHDMNQVVPVDQGLIDRARRVLIARQKPDGSWSPDEQSEIFGSVNNTPAVTAYVAWSLAKSGGAEENVRRALDYLANHIAASTDTYTLALVANAFATAQPKDPRTLAVLSLLENRKTMPTSTSAIWKSRGEAVMFDRGGWLDTETTALVAQADLTAGQNLDSAGRAVTGLIRQRGADGGWGTTQSTILALQALVKAAKLQTSTQTGDVDVTVNARKIIRVHIGDDQQDVVQLVDLTPYLEAGENRVTLDPSGKAKPTYDLVAQGYVSWKHARKEAAAPLISLVVKYDRTKLAQNGSVDATVIVTSNATRVIPMLMVDVGLAPGFAPDAAGLDRMAAERKIERYEILPRQLTIYLSGLAAGAQLRLPITMRAGFPIKAVAPPSSAWEYYDPSNRAQTGPTSVVVKS